MTTTKTKRQNTAAREAAVIFPNQLFLEHPAIKKGRLVVLAEDWLFFRQYAFHKQKIVLHRASMKAYEQCLKDAGHEVRYLESHEIHTTEKIFEILEEAGVRAVHIAHTSDDWLEQFLESFAAKHDIELVRYQNPGFLSNGDAVGEFFKVRKNFLMKDFYIFLRKQFGILTDRNGQPAGGKWIFRIPPKKTIERDLEIPGIWKPSFSLFVHEAVAYTDRHFQNNPGMIESFFYPVTHEQAKCWLDDFLLNRLNDFAFYRRAIIKDELVIFHSVLSPMLNSGLLTPMEVVRAAVAAAERVGITCDRLENFLRQVIGWREFAYATYLLRGRIDRKKSAFAGNKKMPAPFLGGNTGIDPVDTAIKKLLYFGYIHHTERLMLNYFFALCEIDPKEVFKFFMSLSIDSYDWVVTPNVFTMRQPSSDLFAWNRRYFLESRYFLKISDYETGKWSDIWDGLHRRFVTKNAAALGAKKPPAARAEGASANRSINLARKYLGGIWNG